MRRLRIIALALVLLAGLGLLFWRSGGNDPNAPRFVAGPPKSLMPFTAVHYTWNVDRNFDSDQLWLWTSQATNFHSYLYHLEQRRIVGELFYGGTPEAWLKNSSEIMTIGPDSPGVTLKEKLFAALGKMFGKRWATGSTRTETFWFLDLAGNRASRAGSVSQFSGSGSSWRRSPSARYAFTAPSTGMGNELFICDLKNRSFTRVPARGTPCGWWSETEILLVTGANRFDLLEINSRKSRPLLTPETIASFLSRAKLAESAIDLYAGANWNGHDYDFYLGPKDRWHGLTGTNGFLLKLDRAGPSLRVISPDFKFRWGGHLESSGTLYLYQGERGKPGAGGDGSVWVHNLTNHTDTLIVPPDNKGQYSIPRWYGNEIIYFRDRLLRRVKLDGMGDELVLPSPE